LSGLPAGRASTGAGTAAHEAEVRRQFALFEAIERTMRIDRKAAEPESTESALAVPRPSPGEPDDPGPVPTPPDGMHAGADPQGHGRADGLVAYADNANSNATRALELTYPTLLKLIGIDEFRRVARAFRAAMPPVCGDLAEWGAELPGSIEADAALSQWPYLGDCARLDLAVQRCERAADARLDADSLRLLERIEPSRLAFRLMPGSAVLESRWPIAALHAAHRQHGVDLGLARGALAACRAECVLVVRAGWRADVVALERPVFQWTQAILEGQDLAKALERAGGAFDFSDWLATALRGSWLQCVVCRGA
jgi:hypothetical protein